MYKKIISFILTVCLIIRLIPTLLQVFSLKTLPLAVIISSLTVCCFGIYAILKATLGKFSSKNVVYYLFVEMASIVFNLFYCSFLYNSNFTMQEILVVGNVFSLIINPICIFFIKSKKYIKIKF